MAEPVLVLGAGPSGMMAAHAVAQQGLTPRIVDRNPDRTRRSSGVYYLHSDCGLALRVTLLRQRLVGNVGMSVAQLTNAYAEKVYGREVESRSVLEVLGQSEVGVYNASEALEHLWDMYGGLVEVGEIQGLEDARYAAGSGGKVISTIPARVLFPQRVYSSVQANVHVSEAPVADAFVYYNVSPAIPWYRCAAVFGVFTAEYPEAYVSEGRAGEWRRVTKVIGTDRPLPEYDWLISTGRYGAWNKGFLTDTVYSHVSEQLKIRGWV